MKRSHMSIFKITTVILLLIGQLAACEVSQVQEVPPGLSYSGETSWDASMGSLSFKSSGQMPEGKEDFFWQVPSEVKRIYIERNVTVTGGFRVGFRSSENPLYICGEDRKTSVVLGTETERWRPTIEFLTTINGSMVRSLY